MTEAAGPTVSFEAPSSARLDALSDAAVRDIAWLLFSPDLLRAQPPAGALAKPFESPDEAAAAMAWLEAQDADPAGLHRHIDAARVTRLGRYAECLLAWFLKHGPAARLIAANVPLRRAGVTLGECDFLAETRAGRRLHWELAVKCYLHAGDGRGELADYVGPNLQDRFDLKLAHLLHHQLRLSAREEFASLGHRGPWDAQMFVKGWLFYRNGRAERDPAEIEPAHARGWWTTRAEWTEFSAGHADAWMVLPRLEWLALRVRHAGGASPEATGGASHAASFVSADMLAQQLAGQTGPAMVAAFVEHAAGQWSERSRGFIVPDDWPEQAHAFARQSTRRP
ncbi:DUF1853 family protein [Paraburkholderia phymatum]|uniref:DUF1853 domain-containing protein n=1 Tax=Paraburkholderia phymatum (strain DSM 17167 / CIP 108236 / LMG 21445 / STM815) TaxID=391038 RepID=B2JIF0_PARP8|nr:DUF1853 family protein [Paraburkholderia phymatum]ACC70544.1 Domain of unknown function DUF1853 [Paraburkholderia phymatum STM815]